MYELYTKTSYHSPTRFYCHAGGLTALPKFYLVVQPAAFPHTPFFEENSNLCAWWWDASNEAPAGVVCYRTASRCAPVESITRFCKCCLYLLKVFERSAAGAPRAGRACWPTAVSPALGRVLAPRQSAVPGEAARRQAALLPALRHLLRGGAAAAPGSLWRRAACRRPAGGAAGGVKLKVEGSGRG